MSDVDTGEDRDRLPVSAQHRQRSTSMPVENRPRGRTSSIRIMSEESESVAIGRCQIGDADHLDDAEQQPAHHGAIDAAEAADQHDGQALGAHVDAHVRRDRIEVQADQHAGNAGERRGDRKGEQDDVIDIDAEDAGDLEVLRGGAHRHAVARARHEQMQQRSSTPNATARMKTCAPRHRYQAEIIDVAGKLLGKPQSARRQIFGHDLLQHQPGADAADDRRKISCRFSADRAECHELQHHAEHRRANQAADQRNERPDIHPQHDLQADERADHEHFAVREMQHPQDAEDQRIADGDEGIGAAQHHAIGELLYKHEDISPARARRRAAMFPAYCATTNLSPLTSRMTGLRIAIALLVHLVAPINGASWSFMLAQQSRILTRSAWMLLPVSPGALDAGAHQIQRVVHLAGGVAGLAC